MRHILASMVLVVLLFPALALGEEVKFDDLVITSGLYYKKFTNVPFTGKVTGRGQGVLKNGKRVGVWVEYNKEGRVSKEVTYENGKEVFLVQYKYHDNGQLWWKGPFKDGKKNGPFIFYRENGQLHGKGTFRDGKLHGPSVSYNKDGTVDDYHTGTYKDGKKVK